MTKKLHHILVIDDDTRLRTLLGRFLEENGFQVSLAKDTDEAKKMIQELMFDLLIVDVMLPNENGVDFTSDLRKFSKIKVINLTNIQEYIYIFILDKMTNRQKETRTPRVSFCFFFF